MQIRIKRIYEPPAAADGFRVLVDRLWPRGVKKEEAAIDMWVKQLAPSSELRKWFGHEDARFKAFSRRYRAELDEMAAEVEKLIASTRGRTMTLVYAARNTRANHALVLQEWLQRYLDES